LKELYPPLAAALSTAASEDLVALRVSSTVSTFTVKAPAAFAFPEKADI
jgi:hypothetical protein